MAFKGGYAGNILEVELSTNKTSKRRLDEGLAQFFLGGRGFTSKIQLDEIAPEVDGLTPENLLIFATGPLTGGPPPCSARFVVAGRSPLTGILGDANCGGHWAPELKFAGYDMIKIRGRASKPVYLWIDDDDVEIRNANQVWGHSTLETEAMIKEEIGDGDVQVASIGQGGENLVRFACVMANIDHAAGKTGMGAVMGSKNLKAVAVRGSKDLRVADETKLRESVESMRAILEEDPISHVTAPKMGTTMLLSSVNEQGAMATRNWQTGVFEGADRICGETLYETYMAKTRGCFNCPIRCDQFAVVDDGEFKGTFTGGPEYNALVGFGAKIGNDNLASILKANQLVNYYGLDVQGASGVIGFAFECYEKGILKSADVDGLELRWGNYKAMLELIEKIAFRRGVGQLLADGTGSAAKRIGKGAENYAMHVKNLDLVTVDPRARKAYSLRYAIATRGADHLRIQAVVEQKLLDQMPIERVGERIKWWEDFNSTIDAAGICKFGYSMYSSTTEIVYRKLKELARLYSAIVGVDVDETHLLQAGERITNAERLHNVRCGRTRKDDVMPGRFSKEPMPKGPAKGSLYDRHDALLDSYYKARGWNIETGIPSPETLQRLGVEK